MDLWIWFLVGYGAGFGCAWLALIWIGRKQIRDAFKQFKDTKEK